MVMVKNKHGDELQNVIIHADTIVGFVIIQHGKVCSFRYQTYKVSQITAMQWEISLIATIKNDFVDEHWQINTFIDEYPLGTTPS